MEEMQENDGGEEGGKRGGVPQKISIQLHTTAYYCILLHTTYTTAYYCILLHTIAYYLHYCILLYTTAYYCILLYTTVHYMLTKHPSLVVCDIRVLKVEASAELTVREKERLFVWLLW